ncbi:MAG: hypothetical protein J5934_07750 [Succinivibrio sp.]|nr:hypothetical protein [Succinivibrio sp.]
MANLVYIDYADKNAATILNSLEAGTPVRFGADGHYGDILHVHVDAEGNRSIGEGVRTERIRRVTGYLTGSMDRFNNAKKAEVHDRVVHMSLNPNPAASTTVLRDTDPLARFRAKTVVKPVEAVAPVPEIPTHLVEEVEDDEQSAEVAKQNHQDVEVLSFNADTKIVDVKFGNATFSLPLSMYEREFGALALAS